MGKLRKVQEDGHIFAPQSSRMGPKWYQMDLD